jgi:hypothetical protein
MLSIKESISTEYARYLEPSMELLVAAAETKS